MDLLPCAELPRPGNLGKMQPGPERRHPQIVREDLQGLGPDVNPEFDIEAGVEQPSGEAARPATQVDGGHGQHSCEQSSVTRTRQLLRPRRFVTFGFLRGRWSPCPHHVTPDLIRGPAYSRTPQKKRDPGSSPG